MNHLALAIVSRTLFNTETNDDAMRISEALDVVLHTLNRLMLPPGPLLLSLPLPSTLRYRRALQTLDEIVYRIIHERRVSGKEEDDLLGLLMQAEDPETGQRMTDLELRDEVMTLFVAGHDTTANALTWTWHLLAQHPEAMAGVAEESRAVLGERSATAEDYPKLTFTERVLAEAMRLYPPVWILGRRSLSEPNSVYLVCMYVLHRRPELYADPNRFDPERFLPENRDGRHKYAYMPFGAGSRLCIGERFAWMEIVLTVATIARRWKLLPTSDKPVEPLALLTLRPKLGLHLRAEPQS
jgi:cytochrome P450